MNKIAFLSVVYPEAEIYLDDFFRSLSEQDYKWFDIIILNDGLEDLDKYASLNSRLYIHEIRYIDTYAKIREKGIRYITDNKYDVAIFGDSDDFFKSNRVSESIRCLKKYDIVVNDFDLISKDNVTISHNYLSKRLSNNQEISLDQVIDKNCFGLSNTAINTSLLKEICFNHDLIAVDWYLFSLLLSKEARAVFTNKTVTYYRQYAENTIGINSLDRDKILRGIDAKCIHYREMMKISDKFLPLYEQFCCLKKDIFENNALRDRYLAKVKNQQTINPLWWEDIIFID